MVTMLSFSAFELRQSPREVLHANIVAIHEVGIHDSQHFLVMDFVDGRNLATVAHDQPLTAKSAAACVKIIAGAIHYAHQQGVLHRDLKPPNVLIDANDQPHVTDFGLARQMDGDSSLTLSGQVMDSPGYMPPEQASGARGKTDVRSDVYSLDAQAEGEHPTARREQDHHEEDHQHTRTADLSHPGGPAAGSERGHALTPAGASGDASGPAGTGLRIQYQWWTVVPSLLEKFDMNPNRPKL